MSSCHHVVSLLLSITKVINDQNHDNQIHSIYHYHGKYISISFYFTLHCIRHPLVSMCEVPQPRRQQQLGLGVSPPPLPPPGYLGDHVLDTEDILYKGSLDNFYIVKLRQGSGKDRQGMAVKAKGLKA